MSKKNILGIEVCDDSVKLIYGYHLSNGFIVKQYKTVRFQNKIANFGEILDMDALIKEISHFISENSIKCKKINVILNSSKIVVRSVKANIKSENEAKKYVELNANNILPIDISNGYYTDFKIDELYHNSSKKLLITIAAAPICLVEQYTHIFSKLKLKPVLVDIYENSIARVFKSASLEEGGVIITLDFYTYSLQVVFLYHQYVIHRLYIKFDDNLKTLSCDVALNEETIASLESLFIDRLRQYVNSYKTENLFGEIKAFYILGEVPCIEALPLLLFEEFGIPVKISRDLYYGKNIAVQIQGIMGAIYFPNSKNNNFTALK